MNPGPTPLIFDDGSRFGARYDKRLRLILMFPAFTICDRKRHPSEFDDRTIRPGRPCLNIGDANPVHVRHGVALRFCAARREDLHPEVMTHGFVCLGVVKPDFPEKSLASVSFSTTAVFDARSSALIGRQLGGLHTTGENEEKKDGALSSFRVVYHGLQMKGTVTALFNVTKVRQESRRNRCGRGEWHCFAAAEGRRVEKMKKDEGIFLWLSLAASRHPLPSGEGYVLKHFAICTFQAIS